MDINTTTSYYINPNTRQLTSNRNNTALKDPAASEFMFDKLRPVKDIVEALKTPLNLADETFIDKVNNELYIAEGSHFTFEGGFVYTVLEKGITCGYGTQEEWNGEVPLPGDASNETLNRTAQEMAGAIVRLLRDATGTIDESMMGEKKHAQFHKDVCKVLEYFGLDSSKDFSINGVKYTRDEDGYFRSEKSYAAQEAYEILRNNNRSYALADESTKNHVHYMSDYYLSSAPEEVRTAWQETLEETGINPFQSGYVSTLQQLATEQDFATGGNDQLFGESIESSIEAIDKILERIANPKTSEDEDYVSSMVDPEQETKFYTTLRNKLINSSTGTSFEDLMDSTGFIAEFIDYEEFHKAWMSQGADTPFSYTENKGFNEKENSISLVPGMSVRLSNGYLLSITDSMVQAVGDFRDNEASKESAAIAGALNHLIKVANGQIPMNMFYSRNQDNSAYAKIGLEAFGIDTTKPFTINDKTFQYDSDGQIRLS